MKNFWDERYASEEYVYGKSPNVFFAEQLQKINCGKILLPCEGEGRNAIFAALKAWEVNAFDSSEFGKLKAEKLAREKNVTVNYLLDDVLMVQYPPNSFDVIAFIYAHFSTTIRKKIHQNAINWLKPGGKIILEAFNPKQLQNTSGGPKEYTMLYSKEMLQDDFKEMKIEILDYKSTELSEGNYHQGNADIIQFVGAKN